MTPTLPNPKATAAKPCRLQLSRRKGAKLVSPNGLPIVVVTRPREWGNPFKIGRLYFMGDPDPSYRGAFGMSYAEVYPTAPAEMISRATRIENAAMAVEWFERLLKKQNRDVSELRGKNLACFCKLGDPCHADVLLRLAAFSGDELKASTR